MHKRTLIFDLDGTLIDSAPSILAGYAAAFTSAGLEPQRPLSADLVGPPLRSTLQLLLGRDEPQALDALVAAFKQYYDDQGYRASRVYAGIDAMLAELAHSAVPLYLATNKRWHPTQLILAHLAWREHFLSAHALDGPQPPQPSKGALLRWMLTAHSLSAPDCLYVGDRDEDGEAAAEAGMPFLRVPWGYGGAADQSLAEPSATATLTDSLKRWLQP